MKVLMLVIIGFELLGTANLVSAESRPTNIEIFTTATIPITNIDDVRKRAGISNIDVHNVAGVADIEAELNAAINDGGFLINDPSAIGEAEIIARERLKSIMQTNDTRARAGKAMQSLALAYGYQLVKLPAVVFDRQTVVYGVSDVRDAVMHYQKWKGTKP